MSEKNWFYNFISDVSVSVDTGNLRTYSTQLSGVCKNSEKIAARIAKICKNFDSVNAIRTVNNGASIVKKCKQYIDFTASAFEDTENYLMKQDPMDPRSILTSMGDPSSMAVAKLFVQATTIKHPAKGKKIMGSTVKAYELNRGWSKSAKGELELPEGASFLEKAGLTTSLIAKSYKLNKTAKKEEYKPEEKKGIEKDITFFDKSKTWIDKSLSLLGENSDNYDLEAFKRETHGSISGGHSTKKGWYVEAEAGASFSLLTGSLQGALGNEVFGIHGNVNAEVGTVSGSLGFSASTKEGFEANLGLEADIVKVGLTGGFTVLGVDAEASANVKVGFGAHAKVGYKKGVVTCDIGAAFGLGFDLKFKVDVKKPVKAVKKAAKAAWRKIKSWF